MSFVERLVSGLFTSKHKDVTNDRINYAKNKQFVFPTKKQLLLMDSNRQMRQVLAANKVVEIQEVSISELSINNLELVKQKEPLKQKINHFADGFAAGLNSVKEMVIQ